MKKFCFIKNAMMASAIAISTLASPLAELIAKVGDGRR